MANGVVGDTLISNIAGNLVRAGQHRPMISGPAAVLRNQEVNLHNNLMQSQAERIQLQGMNEARSAAIKAQNVAGVNKTLKLMGSGTLTFEQGVSQLQQNFGEEGDDAAKDAIEGRKRRQAEADRSDPLAKLSPDARLFKTDPKAWREMQEGKRVPSTNVNVSMGNPEGQKMISAAAKKYNENPTVEGQEALVNAYIAAGDPDTAKVVAGAFKTISEVTGAAAEKETSDEYGRRREGTAASTVVTDIDDALGIMEKYGHVSTGTLGAVTSAGGLIAETPYARNKTLINSIKSNIAIDTLLKIKKEGSGLGQVPQKQLEYLASVLGPIDAKNELSITLKTLKHVRDLYAAIEDRMTPEDREMVGLKPRGGDGTVVQPQPLKDPKDMTDEEILNLY